MTAELVPFTLPTQDGPTLSYAEARWLTDDIRRDLQGLAAKIERARLGRADVALGYPSWWSYVATEFGDLREMRLPKVERQALVASMTTDGLSARAIKAETDWSLDTITRDRQELGLSPARKRPEVVELPPPSGKVYEIAAEWLRRSPAGLTLAELARAAGWSEGKASGALSDCVRRKGLAVRSDDRRGGMRVHYATEVQA